MKFSAPQPEIIQLGEAKQGFKGLIEGVMSLDAAGCVAGEELERRLIEMGFVEGARVEILHEGALGDPIAVRINDTTVALRRREAMAITVRPLDEQV